MSTPVLPCVVCAQCVVMAGGGVTSDNVAALIAVTGVAEVHATARAPVESAMVFRREPVVYMGGEKVLSIYL